MPPFISRVCSEQESILDGDNHPFDNFLHVVRYESSQFLRLFVFRTIGACLTKRVMRINEWSLLVFFSRIWTNSIETMCQQFSFINLVLYFKIISNFFNELLFQWKWTILSVETRTWYCQKWKYYKYRSRCRFDIKRF